MDAFFLITGLLLFIFWVCGIALSIPTFRNLLLGNGSWKYKLKKPYMIRKSSKGY